MFNYYSTPTATVILPLSIHIVMLGAFMLLNGVATGAVDNGKLSLYTP